MARKFLLCLPLLAVFAGLTCAPQDDKPPKKDSNGEKKDGDSVTPVTGPLKDRIRATLKHIQNRDLLTTHAFWTVFHGILGMGFDTTLYNQDSQKREKAIDMICRGDPIRGLEFIPMKDGVDVRTMVGSGVGQGHQDQFIAEMTQWGLPGEKKFIINGKDYTFADFARLCKMRASVKSGQELSWAIVVISQFYGTKCKWTNSKGEELSLEDIVHYEANQPVDETAACGGTHRLFGLTWAYHLHLKNGGNKEGVWREVADKIEEFKKKAREFQNPDGSFSTRYLSGPGSERNPDTRINTTGHVLEWLSLAMSHKELSQDWVEKAAYALVQMILDNQRAAIDGGSLYHAAHGLHIYHDRVFGSLGPNGPSIPLPPGEK